MPPIQKRRMNRVLVKRGQRYASTKVKTRSILCGKLKNNNNLLAKALSIQKQENQTLFAENIKLSSQLQSVIHDRNQREKVVKTVENNSKEMLSLLVTITNLVTNNIVCCQQLTQTPGSRILQPSTAPRRDSTRRLSTKSPTRGVVKPMVSGHTITKPTINLRRINMPRSNNVGDLSIVEEASPNTSPAQVSSFTSRLGYEGGHRRRMPERIPLEFVEADDEDLSRHETRLSERFSARLSSGRNSITRKRSRNSLMAHIQSPRVSVCDVSKLLRNSHSINVKTLEDFRGSRDFNGSANRLSTVVANSPRYSSDIASTSVDVTEPESQSVPEKIAKPITSTSIAKKSTPNKRVKTLEQSAGNVEIDPLEGPSWLHRSSTADPLPQSDIEEERTIEIGRRKHVLRKLDSLSPVNIVHDATTDEPMEFTECVNPAPRIFNDSISRLIAEINAPTSNNNPTSPDNVNISSDVSSDEDEQCTNVAVNHVNQFVTDRRRLYRNANDDDDDTIMLQLSGKAKIFKSNINVFSLPDVNCDVVARPVDDDSEPEVTTTIQILPQTRVPPKLIDENVTERESTIGSLELPKVEDDMKSKKEKTKQLDDKKQTMRRVNFHQLHSGESDNEFEVHKRNGQSTKNQASNKAKISKKKKKASKSVEIENSSSESEGECETARKIDIQAKKQESKNGKKKMRKNQIMDTTESDSSDSSGILKTGNKITQPRLNSKLKDPKSAKIVLEKLHDSTSQGNKSTSVTDQSFSDKSHDLNATNLRTFDVSSNSEQSLNGRPRRQKAPTNLKEQSLNKKLRRE